MLLLSCTVVSAEQALDVMLAVQSAPLHFLDSDTVIVVAMQVTDGTSRRRGIISSNS